MIKRKITNSTLKTFIETKDKYCCMNRQLYSGSEQFLNLIAETFDCIHRAKSKGKPTGFSITESYYLVLGTELFDAMLNSFKNSMKRKRP